LILLCDNKLCQDNAGVATDVVQKLSGFITRDKKPVSLSQRPGKVFVVRFLFRPATLLLGKDGAGGLSLRLAAPGAYPVGFLQTVALSPRGYVAPVQLSGDADQAHPVSAMQGMA
jgi:hypothetical protein